MNTLLVFTVPRCTEKLYPIIPELRKMGRVDCYHLGEMSEETPWSGDMDIRLWFKAHYDKYITNFIEGPGFKVWGQDIRRDAYEGIDFSHYDIVIVDDSRREDHLAFRKLSNLCKERGIPLIGTPHANGHMTDPGNLDIFTHIFCYGSLDHPGHPRVLRGGYPSNDELATLPRNNHHILVVLNLLGFRSGAWGISHTADKDFIKSLKLREIQDTLNVPVVFKIKSRFFEKEHHGYDWRDSVAYIKNICEELNIEALFVVDLPNNNNIICHSKLIISCSPTLALKGIQSRIPTVFIRTAGMPGILGRYPYSMPPSGDMIMKTYINHNPHKIEPFLFSAIEGSKNNNSTEIYMNNIKAIHG